MHYYVQFTGYLPPLWKLKPYLATEMVLLCPSDEGQPGKTEEALVGLYPATSYGVRADLCGTYLDAIEAPAAQTPAVTETSIPLWTSDTPGTGWYQARNNYKLDLFARKASAVWSWLRPHGSANGFVNIAFLDGHVSSYSVNCERKGQSKVEQCFMPPSSRAEAYQKESRDWSRGVVPNPMKVPKPPKPESSLGPKPGTYMGQVVVAEDRTMTWTVKIPGTK